MVCSCPRQLRKEIMRYLIAVDTPAQPNNIYSEKTIEGYLDSITSLTFSKYKLI